MARACVLVIDDSKFVRTTFRRILQGEFDVREEADGEAGWDAIAGDAQVACVFCDISMPRLDGFEVLSRVRASREERIRQLPVIIISGDEDEATRRRAREAGANDFISKTADATEVLARIDTVLRMVRSRQAAETSATHDPQTGAFTQHYLLTEGRKLFAHARRHGAALAVLSFRIDNYARIAAEAGRPFADQLLARIVKGIQGGLRAEDTLARVGEAAFSVLMAGTSGTQAVGFGRRLREQLTAARFKAGERTLSLEASMGLAALGSDAASSLEDLLRLASGRMKPAPVVPPAPAAAPRASLPAEVEQALQALERIPPERLAAHAAEVLRRLRPYLQTLQKNAK